MKEILLTSSVLILAVFGVRVLFRKAISRRVQYALWGLVLLRLLVPFQLPAMEHNVLTAAAPIQEAMETGMEDRIIYALPTKSYPGETNLTEGEVQIDRTLHGEYNPLLGGEDGWVEYYSGGKVKDSEGLTEYFFMWPLEEFLRNIWIMGMTVMGIWFLIANLHFLSKLCKARTPYAVKDCKYPVYLVEEGLPSPCLFGLFRPAIYLTPAAVRDEETLRHVLAHETTHARHLDPFWSALRGACLVIYWFDPLVWAAAFASRTDCELACDEGALKCLGEEQRIPYSRTLLSLIPVRKGPASPLLSATTMTSDKKKLTERIHRIAENRQTVHAALFAVIAIAVMACAMTFTGAKTVEDEVVPLTSAEVHWFNTEFFNGEYLDIQNQFLSSTYESPEDINMFELFYCGAAVPAERSAGTIMSQAERKLLLDTYYDGAEPDCACEKITSADMDIVLLENTGLSLSDTQKIGLENFDYLPKYGAYYFYHGDTNYRSQVVIASGERQGDLVLLYYYDDFMGGVWKCVTLLYREEAGIYRGNFDSTTGKKRVSLVENVSAYHFVSNLPCEASQNGSPVQVILPPGEADRTVKLNNLTEVGPAQIEVHEADGAKVRSALGSHVPQVTIGNTSVVCWKDGAYIHFSYGRTDGNIGESTFFDLLVCPLQGNPDEMYSVERFYNLLGHSGFMISYYGDAELQPRASGNYLIHRYYALEDDTPVLLATTVGGWDQRADLDGDNVPELFFSSEHSFKVENCYPFYFFRDGKIYGLDLLELTFEAYPEWGYASTGTSESSCISITGSYQREDGCYVQTFRDLYFTGEELLFYKDSRKTVDHVLGDPDVPPEVLEIAKREVERLYNYRIEENAYPPAFGPEYDDWRIENLEFASSYSFPNGNIEVYQMNYEFHAGNPQGVGLAGGMYHTEEDWVMPSYPNCYYLCIKEKDGVRELLQGMMINDSSPGNEWFDSEISRLAVKEGLVDSPADLEARELLQSLAVNTPAFLDSMTEMTLEEQKAVSSKLCYFRTSGPEQDQKLYQGTMDALVGWNTYELTTAQYEAWSLLFNYHVCQPAELTTEERYAALDTASTYIRKKGEHEACLAFDLISASIDSYETWRIVNMYADSELAVKQGYDHDTMTHLTAVHVIYDVSWDHTKVPTDEEGRCGMYLYMLPDENGAWFVWDSMTAGIPELYEMVVDSLTADNKVILQLNDSGYITEQDDYWRYRAEHYPEELEWTPLEPSKVPEGNFLTIGNTEMGVFLRCWEDSNLVQVNFLDETAWYETTPLYADAVFDGRLFSMVRQWYDEAEWNALSSGIIVEDRGQSYQEVAQEWVDRYIQAYLNVNPGSQFACTYVRAEASIWDWVPETAYPANTEGKERFYFGYTRVFVPATESALQYQMAGNTTEYDGSLGEAPEGAYMCSQVGPMYLTEAGWRCDGTGTGI